MPSKARLQSFRRVLRYLRPQRRRLMVSVLCALGMALAYTGTIGGVLPVLKLLIANEGPRTTAFRYIAGQRLGAELGDYRPERGRFPTPLPEHALIVRSVKVNSALEPTGVQPGDALFLAEDPAESTNLLEMLAAAPANQPVDLLTVSPADTEPQPVSLSLPEVPGHLALAGRLASHLPADTTPSGRINILIAVLATIFLITVFGNVCRFWAQFLVHIAALRSTMDIRRHMFARTMNMPLAEFSENVSDKMSRVLQDTQEVYRGVVALFGKIVREPLKALGVFGVALWLDWHLTLAVVIGAPIGAWILIEFGRRIRKATLKMLKDFGRVLGGLSATLNGMRVVRGYTREGFERRRMWRIERHMFGQQVKIGRIDALTGPVLEMLATALAMGGIVWLAQQTIGGKMRPELFIQMAVCLGAMFDPIRKISAVFTRLQKADAAAARILEIIDAPAEQPGGLGKTPLPVFSESIEFRRVTFTYPGAEHPAVAEVNLTLSRGQQIAIVGPNGSGKTTLIGLLLRFFEPQQGSILIDHHDVREVGLRSLRDQFSLVTQDAVVFAMTAGENIAYGRRSATPEQIVAAARRAHADEFIRRLPAGYDTLIGESGATLSGGERQRLCLARAILRDAPIFIFDEATSQVDVDSERKIREAMLDFMKNRTSLVIAHRIATITGADKIVVFDRGRIVDVGDHESLLARCDLYKTLFYTHLHGQTEPALAAGQRVGQGL